MLLHARRALLVQEVRTDGRVLELAGAQYAVHEGPGLVVLLQRCLVALDGLGALGLGLRGHG
eukprot:14419626-Alexandrium_andersonii.AAC.1